MQSSRTQPMWSPASKQKAATGPKNAGPPNPRGSMDIAASWLAHPWVPSQTSQLSSGNLQLPNSLPMSNPWIPPTNGRFWWIVDPQLFTQSLLFCANPSCHFLPVFFCMFHVVSLFFIIPHLLFLYIIPIYILYYIYIYSDGHGQSPIYRWFSL